MSPARRVIWAELALAAGVLAAAAVGASLAHAHDVDEYQRYAAAAMQSPWLTHWPKEYPPLSLAVFLLPRLLPLPYSLGFELVAAMAFGLTCWILRKQDARAGLRAMGYAALGAPFLLLARFDGLAALAAAAALWAVRRQRWNWGWAWAEVGFLLKLFPALLAAAALAAEGRRRPRVAVRRALLWLGLLGLGLGLQWGWARSAALSWIAYFHGRPPEVGSLVGQIAGLTHPQGSQVVFSYGSMNVVNSWTPWLTEVAVLLAGACAGYIVWRWWRGEVGLVTALLTLLVALLLSSKVFSIQFLLWLIPFWSYYRWNWWWAGSALATAAAYPLVYNWASQHPQYWDVDLALLLFRSAMLVAGLVAVLRNPQQRAL